MPNEHGNPTQARRGETVMLTLEPVEALRALLEPEPCDEVGDA